MKCLVTGGLGFLGSHLADELIKQNHIVTILDKVSPTIRLNKKIKFIKTDLLNKKKTELAVRNQDIIFQVILRALMWGLILLLVITSRQVHFTLSF